MQPVIEAGPEVHTLLETLPADRTIDDFVAELLVAVDRRPAAVTRPGIRQPPTVSARGNTTSSTISAAASATRRSRASCSSR